jgi:hypothetical protein
MPAQQADERRCQKYACAFQDCLAKQRHIVNDPVEVCRGHFDLHQHCMENARSNKDEKIKNSSAKSGTPKRTMQVVPHVL